MTQTRRINRRMALRRLDGFAIFFLLIFDLARGRGCTPDAGFFMRVHIKPPPFPEVLA